MADAEYINMYFMNMIYRLMMYDRSAVRSHAVLNARKKK